jgi:hypothetical protein
MCKFWKATSVTDTVSWISFQAVVQSGKFSNRAGRMAYLIVKFMKSECVCLLGSELCL